jgi:DNA repair exonuclease SbcCD ATPase subunit
MFIKKIEIKNFRIFSNNKSFEIDNINAPNGVRGSGLTVFVGENGCGKTTILDAIALPILEYK